MLYIRTAIITLTVVVATVVAMMFFTFDTDYEVNQALKSFQAGDLTAARRTLNNLKESISEPEKLLYLAYLARKEHDLPASSYALEQAATLVTEDPRRDLALEIDLNRALNSYLSGDWPQMRTLNEHVKNHYSPTDWTAIFDGLYQQRIEKDHAQAAESFRASRTRKPISPWMKSAFEVFINDTWVDLQLTRCDIYLGEYLRVRRELEAERQASPQREDHERDLLLGLTYLQEAESKPPQAATPYHKLALSYFNRIPIHTTRYASERQEILDRFMHHAQRLLNGRHYRSLPFYVSLCRQWEEQGALLTLTEQLTVALRQSIAEEDKGNIALIAKVLAHSNDDPEVQQKLSEDLEQLLVTTANEGDPTALPQYWTLAQQFTRSGPEFQQRIADTAWERLNTLLKGEEVENSDSLALLDFWTEVEQRPERRGGLAPLLTQRAITLMEDDGGTQVYRHHAEKLVRAARALERVQQPGQESVGTLLHQAYMTAAKSGKSERLPIYLDWIDQLSLNDEENRTLVAQSLKNADELIGEGRYDEALLSLKWIEKQQERSTDSALLLAQTHYRLGKYREALSSLNDLDLDHPLVQEMRAVCTYLYGDISHGTELLQQAARNNGLSDEAFLRLGYEFLRREQPDQAKQWLENISSYHADVAIGLATAAYQKEEYTSCQEHLSALPLNYLRLPEIAGLALAAEGAETTYSGFEDQLKRYLRDYTPASKEEKQRLSLPLQQFLERYLQRFEPTLLASKYYRDMKKRPDAALELLMRHSEPSPEMLVDRAELQYKAGQYDRSLADIQRAISIGGSEATHRRALPLLGQAFHAVNRPLEATEAYRKLVTMHPENNQDRAYYALGLLRLHKSKEALTQFSQARRFEELPQEMYGDYLQCLVNNGRIEEAINQARIWLRSTPKPSLETELQLARALIVSGDSELLQPLLERAGKHEQLSQTQLRELVELLYDMGLTDAAYQLLNKLSLDPNSSVYDCLTLAKLHHSMGDTAQALLYVEQALKKHHDPELLRFLYRHRTEPQEIRTHLTELLSKERPVNEPTDVLQKGHLLIALAEAANFPDAAEEESSLATDLHVALRQTYGQLQEVARKNPDLPEAHYLVGMIQFYSGQSTQALTSLRQAVKLEPCYVDAARGAALAATRQGDHAGAIALLKNAVAAHPVEGPIWASLGTLYYQEGDLLEAKECLLQAVMRRPRDIEYHFALAQLLIDLSNPEHAIQVLEKSVQLEPTNQKAVELLLTTLYDGALDGLKPDVERLEERRSAAYQQLEAIDASAAKQLLSVITGEIASPTEQPLEQELIK